LWQRYLRLGFCWDRGRLLDTCTGAASAASLRAAVSPEIAVRVAQVLVSCAEAISKFLDEVCKVQARRCRGCRFCLCAPVVRRRLERDARHIRQSSVRQRVYLVESDRCRSGSPVPRVDSARRAARCGGQRSAAPPRGATAIPAPLSAGRDTPTQCLVLRSAGVSVSSQPVISKANAGWLGTLGRPATWPHLGSTGSAAWSTVQRPWPPRALSRAGGVARRRQSPAAGFARGAQAYGRCCTVAPRKLPTGVVTESGSGSAPLPHLCLQTSTVLSCPIVLC
jgi:hypothetical protein